MATTKKTYSADEKKAFAEKKRDEQRELLAQAVQNLCSSDGWRKYLETRAKFWNYSFSNTILIALQNPNATQVAGAKKWIKEFSRRVQQEEWSNPIHILAPMFIYAKDAAGKIITDEKGQKVIDRIWYKTVQVYDVSQTEGDPIPTIPLEPITGNSHEEYLYRAEQYATAGLGLTVEYEAMVGERGGYYAPNTKAIKINASREVNGQVRTLIHEIAHALGVDYTDYTKEQAEVIVESAAYLTCLQVGLDTSGMTVPYIASWGSENGDANQALKTLRDFAKVIDELTFKITEAIS